MTGTISWFSNGKGFGFITPEDGSKDIFLHYSHIKVEGYKTVKENQRVRFEVEPGPNGKPQAVKVEPIK